MQRRLGFRQMGRLGLGVIAASGVAAIGARRLAPTRALGAAPRAGSDGSIVLVEARAATAKAPLAEALARTFLGADEARLLEDLHRLPIREVKLNKGGTSISLRLTFADGSRAAFKPTQVRPQTVPRKEVAAYRLDRALGIDRVPPAVTRTVHRDELLEHLAPDSRPFEKRILAETIFDEEGFTRGEASAWIPVIVDSRLDAPEAVAEWRRWLTVGEEIPPGKRELMAQLSTLLVFDLLENNSDRFSGGNLMTSPDGRTLYFMDNTFGFQVEPKGHLFCRNWLARCQKFSRSLRERLAQLDAGAIRRAYGDEPVELSDDEIRGLLARRDVALRYVDDLVARFGAEQVLVFP